MSTKPVNDKYIQIQNNSEHLLSIYYIPGMNPISSYPTAMSSPMR